MGVGADLLVAIPAYTGLSPAAFFTLLALLVAFYYILAGCFAGPPVQARSSFAPPQMEPLPEPVQLGEISEEELSTYNGSDPKKPLLMAIKGQIYDVSQSRMFYGPGGPYALFAGKDASRALAKMSFDEQDLTSNLEGLGACEMDALNDWEWKFNSKYAKVGQVMTKEKGKSRDIPISDVSDNIVEKEGNSDAVSAVVEESKATSRELEEVKEEKQVNEEVKEEEPSCVNGEVKEEETSTKEVKEEKNSSKEVNGEVKEEETSSKEVNGEVKEEETSSKEVNGEVKEEETFSKEVNGEVKEETSFKETKVEAS